MCRGPKMPRRLFDQSPTLWPLSTDWPLLRSLDRLVLPLLKLYYSCPNQELFSSSHSYPRTLVIPGVVWFFLVNAAAGQMAGGSTYIVFWNTQKQSSMTEGCRNQKSSIMTVEKSKPATLNHSDAMKGQLMNQIVPKIKKKL